MFEPHSAIAATEWTHFADIVNVVGRGADGYARRYWDNVGVQYGLQAVATGQIAPAEFLNSMPSSAGGLNMCISAGAQGTQRTLDNRQLPAIIAAK